MKKLFDKRLLGTLAIPSSFLMVTFVFLVNSPIHPWRNGELGTDSGVFQTIAFMMDKGYMPYRDSFDHKGPFLYILNWLGYQIEAYRGIWAIEFITLFFSLNVIYKTARLCCNKVFSYITTFISVSLLFDFFLDGNFTEEYAILLIATSQFVFLDFLLNRHVTKFRLILCGFCFGATCLLRINMIAVWIVFGIGIFALCIIHKQYDDLKKFILFFLLGASLILLPIILWLGANGALMGFWEDYIVFNREYTSASGGRATFSNIWLTFFYFLDNTIVIFAVLIAAYFFAIRDKFLWGSYLCYLFLSLLLLSISGVVYMHYGLVLIPVVSFPIAFLFGTLDHKKDERTERQHLAFIVAAYFIGAVIMPDWLELGSSIVPVYTAREIDRISYPVHVISDYIKSNTQEDDAISVYGNWDIIYLLSERIHATKYSYQFPICEIRSSIKNEYLEDLGKELPKIIVVQAECYDPEISVFLEENGYFLVWSENDSLNGALLFESNH